MNTDNINDFLPEHRFSGLYNGTIHGNRLQLPEPFAKECQSMRQYLIAVEGEHVRLTPEPAIEMIIAEGVTADDYSACSEAIPARIDKDGYLYIPSYLLEFAKILTPDVMVVGQIDSIEIWSTAKWADAHRIDNIDKGKLAEVFKRYGLDP